MNRPERNITHQPPQPLTLKEAVGQIKRSYDFALEKKHPSPFFLVIGAGVSVPGVPLASEIIRRCKERCGPTSASPTGTLISNEYSHWLGEAFPSREMRQDFFRKLIEGKPIPTAHLRLAHLLRWEETKQPFTNLIVTTNFDNFLSRALNLFGKEYVLCDSPVTTPRLPLSNPEQLQIVHVHGSYQFYDIKNLSGELVVTAALSDETTATMSSLLDWVLRDHSPIVVGYGGWDSDVFMSALRRRLRGADLPRPIYWCCYRREDWRSLPDWLQTDDNIRFIESDPPPASDAAPRTESTAEGRVAGSSVEAVLPHETSLTTLDAQVVFDALIQAFAIPEPTLTKNPVAFFAEQLERTLPTIEPRGRDPYRIRAAIDEVKAAAEWVQVFRRERSAAQQKLQRVRDRLRQAKVAEAVAAIMDVSPAELNKLEREDLLDMALEVAESPTFLIALSEQTLAMLRRIWEIADEATQQPATSRRIALARPRLIANFTVLGRHEDAYTELIDYLEYVQRTDDSEIEPAALQFTNALAGVLANSLNRADDAVAIYDEVARRFATASRPRVREQVAKALFNKGLMLETVSRSRFGFSKRDKMSGDLAFKVELNVPRRVARAQVCTPLSLKTPKWCRDEAIASYNEVIDRFADAPEPGLREPVARAMVNKGRLLETLHRHDDAITAYAEMVRRFAGAPELNVREQVAKALNGLAFERLRRAKAKWGIDGEGGFAETLKEAETDILQALEYKPNDPVMLGNQGYILFLQGRSEESSPTLREAIRLGGEAIRNAVLKDADIDPTPLDEAFKMFVRTIVVT